MAFASNKYCCMDPIIEWRRIGPSCMSCLMRFHTMIRGEKAPWTHLDPLELLPGLVHLPGVLVPLGVAAAERLLDLVKLLLDVLVFCLGVLQLGPQPVDLALALLHLLLHLLHLHLGPLIVALVKPQLSLGAPQLILGLVQLVLKFSVFNSSVYTKGTESKTIYILYKRTY